MSPNDEFTITRQALDEAHSALAGCRAALKDAANISVAMEQLRTAERYEKELYGGHNPQFVVTGSSEPMPSKEVPNLFLATNSELEAEIRARQLLGHTHPNYRSSGYNGPVA